jgi:hypothetical protein
MLLSNDFSTSIVVQYSKVSCFEQGNQLLDDSQPEQSHPGGSPHIINATNGSYIPSYPYKHLILYCIKGMALPEKPHSFAPMLH